MHTVLVHDADDRIKLFIKFYEYLTELCPFSDLVILAL